MSVCNAVLPQAHADACAPGAEVGEINVLYFTRDDIDDGLTDITALNEWASRLSNTTSLPVLGSAAPIRFLHVIGELPEGTTSEIPLPLGNVYETTPKTVLSADVYDVGAANYLLYTTYKASGGQRVQLWFTTEGGNLYGGSDSGSRGISGTLKMSHIIPRSKTELEKFLVTFTFDGVIETKVLSPFVSGQS